jgi:rare lipoprotein A
MDSFYWSLVGRGGLLAIGRRELVVVALTVLFIVFGCRSRTLRSEFQAGHTLSGIASWYGKEFNGKPTASGMTYDMYDLTAAHRTLPFGTMVEVRNLNNAERVVVEINDRGPFVKGRIIDLSYEAARKLGIVEDGTAPVDLRLLLLGDVDKKRLKYRVQVGSFADWTNARELQNRLRRQYPDVVIQPWVGPQGRFYRVRVGPYATLRDAEIAAGQLEDQGLTTFLVQD